MLPIYKLYCLLILTYKTEIWISNMRDIRILQAEVTFLATGRSAIYSI
jgi:hypothetical protein